MKTFFLIFYLFPLFVSAQLTMGAIFSDNMVLQYGKPICIYGKANPNQLVSVRFLGETKSELVPVDSNWMVVFKKQPISISPNTMQIICGQEQITYGGIVLGDVWLCIGQSNMEFPMIREMHFKEEKSNSHFPLIRFYNPVYPGKNTYNTAFSDSIVHLLNSPSIFHGHWEKCDSNSLKTMSAVAYYFAKSIFENTEIPIGLINISIGGAPLETFISDQTLRHSIKFANKVSGNWLTNPSLPIWVRERGSQNVGTVSTVNEDAYGKNHTYKPGFAYDASIASLTKFPIKGILCYQGESNAQELDRVYEYLSLTNLMVKDFRKKWHNPKMPYYFVQLSSKDTLKYKSVYWPEFRDQQRLILDHLPNSGMAVCSDLGFKNDVHPTNKKDVGVRLAKWALYNNYHTNLTPSGPLPLKAKYLNGKVVISFKYPANGLEIAAGEILKGFSFDGVTDALAIIKDKTVLMNCDKKPAYIYYGWKPFTDANLINSDKLPASTFKIPVL